MREGRRVARRPRVTARMGRSPQVLVEKGGTTRSALNAIMGRRKSL
ncbi:MAG: hypothetical protein QXD84_05960 [Thermoplasmata archaeon]